ncbi:MAG: CopG family ribbon-helix-helix protein [Alphaproteobacteria bacterium]|nr:CopG family ribbon-helix-helix protein [Alphaproteobacteria bacterium]
MNNLNPLSTTLSVRVTSTLKNKIDQLAQASGRSRSFIAEEALKRYVENESWQVQAINEAFKKADSRNAKFVEHSRVKEWLASWGTSKEKHAPKCK